jgi:cell division protein FtsQ
VSDPRIHARRVVVARQRGRRRRHRIVAALVVAAVVAGSVALVHSSVFGARHVRVLGAPNIPTSTVISVAGLQDDPPLVDLNPGSMASRIEHLPWVLTAAVRIGWPSTVAIRVTERIPVAAIAVDLAPGSPASGSPGAGSYAVCDVTGRVLEILPARPSSLPIVALDAAGAGAPGTPGSSLPSRDRLELEAAAAMPESMVPEIGVIAVSSAGAVVSLPGGREAILGNGSLLSEKFVSLATVLAHANLDGIGAIDVRVPAAPILLAKASSPIFPGIVGG